MLFITFSPFVDFILTLTSQVTLIVHCTAGTGLVGFKELPEESLKLIDEAHKAGLVAVTGAL